MSFVLDALIRARVNQKAPVSARKLASDERAVAAVEFALILPLMLLVYLGLFEVSQSLRASQKLDLVAHTLSDLTAQQLTGGANAGQAGIDDTTIDSIFSAASILMSPFSAATLRMTISEVTITKTAPEKWEATTTWTVSRNSGPPRSCNVKPLEAADKPPVSSNSMPTSYTHNANGVDPVVGPIIVADVIYSYRPLFNLELFKWNSPTVPWSMARTSYSPVRNTYNPKHIQYYMSSGENCNATP